MGGILVVGELDGGKPHSITGELLAAGRQLADASGDRVAATLLGSETDGASDDAISLGADTVYLVQDPLLETPVPDTFLAALEYLCKEIEPTVVLIGKTPLGAEVGPRLGFRLAVGVAQDCLEVDVAPETGRVLATRAVYGGNALAKLTFPDADPQIVIIRPKVFEQTEPDTTRTGEVVTVRPVIDPSVVRSQVVETVRSQSEGVRLEDAAVVVSGGRGMGGPENFDIIQELAKLLGGAVGASRAVCDAGWLDHSYQVGLTGKTITPNLYITVGISGASQHMAGCSGAKHIVAINRDGDTNIFKAAHFGVVGDWQTVLPSFVETVRELRP
jgi:electron transfer flavoprotein alpha subunit